MKKNAVLWAAILFSGCSSVLQKQILATDNAPKAIGPYSQAVQVGRTIWCAGQIGLDPASGQLVEGGIVPETHRVMQNIGAVLQAAHADFAEVTMATVYLADLADFQAFNAAYATYFPQAPPARATVQVAALPRGARVQIAVTAVKLR